MKLKNLLTTVLMLFAFALAVNSTALAATIYVNNNGGVDTRTGQNDNVLDVVNGPVATITRAVELATDGDVISIAYTGVPYTEPGPPLGVALITKSVTLTPTGAGANQLIIDKVTMNGASKTATFDGAFTIQSTLYLQAGTVAGGTNITLGNGAAVRRNAGSLAAAPTFGTSVNLQYDASANLGSEFPTSATVANNLSVTAGTLTVNRAIQIKGTLNNAGTIALGVNDFTITSTAATNHIVDGSITSSTGKLIFDAAAGSGAYTINVDRSGVGGMALPGIVFQNAARTLQFGLANLDDDLVITGDVMNAGPGTIAFTNTAFAAADEVFMTGNLTNASSGAVTFGDFDVTIQGSTGVTNSGNFAVANGAGVIDFGNTTGGNDVTISGSVVNSAVVTGTVDQVTRQTMAQIVFGGGAVISGNVTNSPDIAVTTTNNAASVFQDAGKITFADVALTITGATSNSAVRTTGTAGASATTTDLGNITFANDATNVVFTGGLTNSAAGFASPITSSGSIIFSARTTGTVTVGTGASNKNIVNSSTSTGGNGLIDLTAASTGATSVNGTVSLEGAAGDGDIIFGVGNLTTLGISITRNVSGSQVTVAADGGVNHTHTLGVFNMSASNATFSIGLLTGGASAVSLNSLNISGGTAIFGSGASTANVSVTGNVLATGGTLDFGTAVRNVNLGGLDINMAGVGFANSGNTTLIFNRGTSGQTFTSGVNVTWPGNFTVSNTFPVSPIFTFAAGNFTVAGTVTFTANASTTNGIDIANGRLILTKAGLAFDNAEGYTGSSGVISLQGTAAQVVKGVGGFYAIECNNAAGLTFGDGASGVVTHPITGALYLTLGDVTTDATGGNESTIAFVNSTTPPTILRSAGSLNAAAATAFTNAVNVVYTGTANITAGAELGGATDINGLSVLTAGGQTVTLAAAEVVNGTLTVNSGQTLALAGFNLTQNGASVVVNGNITATTGKIILNRTGGTTVTGSGQLPDIDVANGSLANVINGSAGLNENAGGVGTGDLTLLGTGTLTATFSGSGPHVAQLTVGTGTLALGGNLIVADNMVINAGTVNLGTSSLRFRGAANTISSGASFTGTGTLVANRTGAQTLDAVAPGSAFTVSNFEVNLSVDTDVLTVGTTAANMIVNGILTITKGDLNIADGRTVTVSGSSIVLADAANSIITTPATGVLVSDANSTLTITSNADFGLVNLTVADSTTIGSNQKLTVSGNLTHSAGLLTLSTKDISVTGTGSYTRTGGTYASNGGYLDWAASGAFTEGTGFSIPNLKVSAALNPASNNTFVVRDNLYLNAATLTHAVSGAGKLTLGVAGGTVPTITIVGAGNIDVAPVFAQGHVNYVYTGATTPVVVDGDSKYWPNTPDSLAADLTINMGNNTDKVRFDQSRTVNDTASLNLTKGVLSLNDNVVLTLANAMMINKNANASLVLDDDADGSDGTGSVAAPGVKLVYSGTQSTGAEFTAPTAINSFTVSSGTVTIDDSRTIAGSLTANDNLIISSTVVLNGALAIADGKSLTINGTLSTASNVAISGTGTITGNGTFNFTGVTGQTLSIPGGVSLGSIGLNMTGVNPVLNVTGGNLSLQSITFTNGILNMGTYTLTLPRPDGAAFSGLAFNRDSVTGTRAGHVVGKVKRHGQNGDGAAGLNGNFAFPVGTMDGQYRPVFINFTPSYVLGTEVDFIVNHVAASPEGTVNLPLPYPDYYWLIQTSPVNLSPTQRFDITVVGTGVPFDDFQDMRIERRQDGNINNPWSIQGTADSYVNFLDIQDGDTSVTVTTTSSLGGLVTVGSRFTIGVPGGALNSISGTVTYDNAANTPLSDVVVTLNPGGLNATTDANGNYTIEGVANGDYTVTATTAKAWGGVNATDALGVLLHTISNPALTGLRLTAADVNNSSSVNATDAQQILLRANGNITSFAKGDWVFSSLAVNVNNVDLTGQNLKGLTTGDVNGSYTPTVAKTNPSLSNAVEGKVQVNPTDLIELPVKVASNMNVAAMTLAFTYPQNLVTFEAVSSKASDIVSRNADGKVSIAWASLKALDLKADDAIVTLKFKPTEQFKAGSKIDVQVDQSVSEIADITGKVINATLKLASVEGFVPAEFALKQNYPNPFNPATTIRYELPVAGTVNLTVYNSLGEAVTTLVNEVQEAGVYKLNWNAFDLASGIYFYRIDVKAGDKSFTKTNKMILMK
jgi:hypothetical protein